METNLPLQNNHKRITSNDETAEDYIIEIETRFLLYLLLNITGILKDDINVKQFNKLRFNRDRYYYDNLKTVKTLINKQIKEENVNKVK